MENGPGPETKKGSPLAKFKDFLSKKGFVFDDKVVNAVEYNVPQNRKRYVLIASRIRKRIVVPDGNSPKIKTVRKAISDLQAIPAGFRDKSHLKHWAAGLKPINLARIQSTSCNGGKRLEWK